MNHGAAFFVGPGLAIVYVAVITSILWWMLSIPAAGGLEQQVSRITREAGKFARIVVPLQGDFLSDRLVALASQMAKFRGASMDVIYIIEVPLQLPITANLPDQEEAAKEVFEKARRIASRYDVTLNSHVERARHAGPAIVQYVSAVGADLLLMGDVPKENRRGTKFARSVEYVFENAPCEVILDRPAPAA